MSQSWSCGQSQGCGGPWYSASLLVCWLGFDKAGYGGPSDGDKPLVGGVGIQGTPGLLLPAHWWVKLGLGASDSPLAGRVGSWGLWLQGPGVPEVPELVWTACVGV